ncbi:MAG: hypothetical protein B6244_13630 [Candidatus Cloacimonetes bacterium 4572_55]|nr:MAG: hypothetical protein B6244_13630 [Candidatus Cloacimonetes bacterium 4572_55]
MQISIGLVKRFIIFLAIFSISSCATSKKPRSLSELKSPELQEKYQQAIKDAETADADEINKDLTAITRYNPDLVWQDSLVSTVTWTEWNGFDDKVGQRMDITQDVWVTIVPELKRFCHQCDFSSQDLTLRLEQILGLPPHSEKTRFVEIWVDPSDIFRPAPDPEITDHEAELDFPISGRFVTIDTGYQEWFNNLKGVSYQEKGGYPWTRLGYSYDWGNPESEVGLSEFVIRVGAVVTIGSIFTIEEYCEPSE